MSRQAKARSYFIGAASLALAWVLRLALDPVLGTSDPYAAFLLAIAVTGWFGGFWPALIVTVGGYLVADWFFIPTRDELNILHPAVSDVISALLYCVVGAVIAAVTQSLRRAQRQADDGAREIHTLFDAAPIAIWVAHDPGCNRITGNRFADELLGIPIGSNVSMSASAEQQAVTAHPMQDGRQLRPDELALYVAARTGTPVVNSEFDLVFEDGRTMSFAGDAVPLRDAHGRVRGAIAAMSDVSAAKRAARLSASVQRITDAMLEDLTPEALLHEVLVRVQEALATQAVVLLVGKVEEQEGLVLRVRAVVGPDMEVGSLALRSGFAVAVAAERRAKVWTDIDPPPGGAPLLREGPGRSLAGVPLWLGEQLVGVLEVGTLRRRHFTDEDLNLLQIAGERVALAMERAARQEAEQQIRASLEASNRTKDEFLAMLGHELRNPLSAVRNAVAAASLDEVRRPRALEIARRQINQLGRLIDDLLDAARITQGRIVLQKEHMNLAEIIDRSVESVRPLTEERGVRVIVAKAPGPIRVEADPSRLEQVFVNLLSNGAKYTDPGGRIDVVTEQQGDAVAVHVRDTGIGIAPEMLPRIWDLFAQADRTLARAQGGLGIGLTLARRLVELHGGAIEAHSEGCGKGTDFVVRLVALPAATEESLPHATPVPSAERCARVLVVEDNPDTAESLMILLEALGHRVRTVHDGAAAIHTAHSSPPDIMLVDLGLPGMDGYEVARRVRRDPGLDRVALIALTGYGREEDKRKTAAAGFDRHLVKPVSLEVLQGVVAQLAS